MRDDRLAAVAGGDDDSGAFRGALPAVCDVLVAKSYRRGISMQKEGNCDFSDLGCGFDYATSYPAVDLS